MEISTPKIVRQRGMCTDAGEACREEYERWQDVQRDRDVVRVHERFSQSVFERNIKKNLEMKNYTSCFLIYYLYSQ